MIVIFLLKSNVEKKIKLMLLHKPKSNMVDEIEVKNIQKIFLSNYDL